MKSSNLFRLLVLITICVAKNLAFKCGEMQVSFPLVAKGIQSRKGQWPWLVSLQAMMQSGPDEFFCGASLINEWTLVTGESLSRFSSYIS